MILCVDPGTTHSAYLFMGQDGSIRDFKSDATNMEVRNLIAAREYHDLVIEEIRSYGMACGKSTFDTVRWIGRFQEVGHVRGFETKLVGRLEVKIHLCKTAKAKDANVRQALLDIYGKTATKGIATHAWAALALATFWHQTHPKTLVEAEYAK